MNYKTFLRVIAATFFVSASPALAAGGHGPTPPPPLGDFVAGLGVYYFNFACFCLILFFVLRKPLRLAFAARRSAIEEKVLAGARALAAAEAELQEAKTLLSSVRSELERVATEISAETVTEIKVIEQEAKLKVERIGRLAQDSAAAELRAMESMVREELIESALLLARERLVRENSLQADQQFRDSTARKVKALIPNQPNQMMQ